MFALQAKEGRCMRSKQPGSVSTLPSHQEGTVVAAEGIDKSGKGVLQITFMDLSKTDPRALESQRDAASTSLRIPVDVVEMMGFSRAEEDEVGLFMRVCAHKE